MGISPLRYFDDDHWLDYLDLKENMQEYITIIKEHIEDKKKYYEGKLIEARKKKKTV